MGAHRLPEVCHTAGMRLSASERALVFSLFFLSLRKLSPFLLPSFCSGERRRHVQACLWAAPATCRVCIRRHAGAYLRSNRNSISVHALQGKDESAGAGDGDSPCIGKSATSGVCTLLDRILCSRVRMYEMQWLPRVRVGGPRVRVGGFRSYLRP